MGGDRRRANQSPDSTRNDQDPSAYPYPGGVARYDPPTPRRGVAPADLPGQSLGSGRNWGDGATTARLEEPGTKGGAGFGVILLVLLALVAVCVLGFLVARVFLFDSSPALPLSASSPSPSATNVAPQPTAPADSPAQVHLTIEPGQGYVNTLVTAIGEGWWPGEPVFISLRSRQEDTGAGYAYAAAVADDGGRFRAAFTFPNEMRWVGEEWADVVARGTRSGLEATTRFILLPPAPTHTPTPYPTLPPTNTPRPTATPKPTDTPSPTATPTPEVVITEWRGEYFSNAALAGTPALIRNDETIDFNWGAESPAPGIPADQFSVRWTRVLPFKEALYRLSITADDGVRFWMDGRLLVDEWHDSGQTTYAVDVSVSEGGHSLQLEYYEGWGGAMVQFDRQRIKPSPPPSSSPLPAQWQADYYDNPFLDGDPVLARDDSEINFSWGLDSPGAEVPADGFSARWKGTTWLAGGTYTYYLVVDDGARVWLDRQLILDAWPALVGQTYTIQLNLEEGEHRFRVEYFEGFVDAQVHLWGEPALSPVASSP